jgi:hypothetical protein
MRRVQIAISSDNDLNFMIELMTTMVEEVKVIVECIINRPNPCEFFFVKVRYLKSFENKLGSLSHRLDLFCYYFNIIVLFFFV